MIARGARRVAEEAPDLPEDANAALEGVEAATRREVETIRHSLLTRETQLSTTMRRVERLAEKWPGWVLVDFWAWVAFLVIVRNCQPDTTVDVYANNVARFIGWTLEAGLDHRDLSPSDFDRWQQWLFMELRNSAVHRKKQLSSVRNYYDWRSTRLGDRNCAAAVRAPTIETRMPRKYTHEQVRAMLEQSATRKPDPLPVRDRAMILFLLATGARRHEVCGVNVDDLQLRTNTGLVHIRGKRRKEREISIEGPVVQALQQWLIERERLMEKIAVHPKALFVGTQARWGGARLKPAAVEHTVAYAAKRAALKEWGVHRFRVTFATWLYDQGSDIEEIRIAMGHASIETTRRYLSVSDRMRKTRLSSERQHQVLGTRNAGRPRWVQAAMGGLTE